MMKLSAVAGIALSFLLSFPALAKIEYGGEIARAKKLYPVILKHFCSRAESPKLIITTCKIDRLRVIGNYVLYDSWVEYKGLEEPSMSQIIERWNGKNWIAIIGGGGAMNANNAIEKGVPRSTAETLVPVICPGYNLSDYRIKPDDVHDCSEWDLLVSRNSIYARYGRTFTYPPLHNYFNGFEWYVPNPKYHDDMLSETDKHNIRVIQAQEKAKGYM